MAYFVFRSLSLFTGFYERVYIPEGTDNASFGDAGAVARAASTTATAPDRSPAGRPGDVRFAERLSEHDYRVTDFGTHDVFLSCFLMLIRKKRGEEEEVN